MERKNIFLILGIILIAVIIFVVKRFMGSSSDCPKLSYTISAPSIIVGESIQYSDNTTIANEWKWDFGDGEKSDLQTGEHIYKSAGKFTITLIINNKCTETTTIEVKDVVISSQDTTQKSVEIIGPSTCSVGDKIHFGNNTSGATNWEWQFGETGSIDSKEQNPTYSFNKPGNYTVVLRVDASKQEGRHKITVMQKAAPAAPGAPKPAKISDAELKAKFESILAGNFSDVYYDILKKYFCDNDHINVEINGSQNKGIYSYCMQLNIQRNTKISDVKITYDKDCIGKVAVTQK